MTLQPLLIPLEGFDHANEGLGALLGLGGFVAVIALLVCALLFLRRFGLLPQLSTWFRRPSPEDSARQVLAERMARGEVSTEEFLERASVLNWTPGSDLTPRPSRRR